MKAILIIVPVVAIGTVLALGLTGVVKIPGLTPAKALKRAAAQYAEGKDKPLPPAKATTPPVLAAHAPERKPLPKPQVSLPDPEVGAEALATVWNEVSTPELVRMSANWKDEELSKVLLKMDNGKLAKFLEALAKGDAENKVAANPVRASKLSRIIRDLASLRESGKTT